MWFIQCISYFMMYKESWYQDQNFRCNPRVKIGKDSHHENHASCWLFIFSIRKQFTFLRPRRNKFISMWQWFSSLVYALTVFLPLFFCLLGIRNNKNKHSPNETRQYLVKYNLISLAAFKMCFTWKKHSLFGQCLCLTFQK